MVEKIVWTQKALCDLRDIFDYINKNSASFAEHTTTAIVAKVQAVKQFPEAGRIVPEFSDPFLRQVIHKYYRIIYRIESATIYVVRIYHSSRLLSSI